MSVKFVLKEVAFISTCLTFFFIYFDFLHHLLSEIKEKKIYVFLQHFVYQHYIEVKDVANWMLCMH